MPFLLCLCIVGMKARTMLAVLDWNSRVHSGQMQYDVVASKRRKTWVVRKRSTDSGGLHIGPLMDRTLQVHINNVALPLIDRPSSLAPYICPVPKPDKEEMLAKHKTRFDA